MEQVGKYQPPVQETISPVQIPSIDIPQTRERKPEEVFGKLATIKREYDSWLPEDHYDIPFYKAVTLCYNNSETSYLVKKDPDKLKDIKDAVFQILSDNKLTLSKVFTSFFVTGYDYDILSLFDSNSKLKKGFLQEIFEQNKGPENHQKRRELVLKAIDNGEAYRHKPTKIETQKTVKKSKTNNTETKKPAKIKTQNVTNEPKKEIKTDL